MLQQKCLPLFQSTLPVWGATLPESVNFSERVISIHAPRVGSDISDSIYNYIIILFQSTLPVWGATPFKCIGQSQTWAFQSTLPVWGATGETRLAGITAIISIHAPRVGSDTVDKFDCIPCKFQSTLPVWGATLGLENDKIDAIIISIHAPRVGSDCSST